MRGLADIGVICRTTVAWVLFLSAMFKLRHPGQFRYTLDAVLRGSHSSVGAVAAKVLPPLEISLAVLLFVPLVPLVVSRAASVIAAILLAGFIVVLIRGDSAAGCGCWRTSMGGSTRKVNIARNIFLIVLAVVSASAGLGASLGVWLVASGFGIIAAFMLLELASIATAVSATRIIIGGGEHS